MHSTKYCVEQFKKSKKIAIITHSNPDADALCSSIALKRLLKKMYDDENNNLKIDIFTQADDIGDKYNPILKGVTINEQSCKRYDLAISLDCASKERMGKYLTIFKKAKDTLNIDHHSTNTRFAKNNICASKCSSTCEIIYSLFLKILNWEASADIYRLIYAGIITDTNNLSQNVNGLTLRILSELMKLNTTMDLNLEKVKDLFFKNNTKEQMSLLQRALNSIMFYENNKVAIMKLVKLDFNETNCTQEDTLGIVDYAINIKGVDIGVIFIKNENNTYYVSLRGKNNIDVSNIAKKMGGGGHKNMAAFQTKEGETLVDIKTKLLSYCKEELAKIENEDDVVENLFIEEHGADNEDENKL